MSKRTYFIIFLTFISHCELKAQWEKVLSPQSPEALGVHKGFFYIGGEQGIHKSNDIGKTWTEFNEGIKSNVWPPGILSFNTYGEYLFTNVANLGGGLCRYIDGQEKWTVPKTRMITNTLVGIEDRLFLCDGNMFRSIDSGDTWIQSDTGIAPRFGIAAECWGIMKIEDTLYTTNRNGQLYSSTNKGSSWEPITNDNAEFLKQKRTFFSHKWSLFASDNAALMRSTNGGYHWDTIVRYESSSILSYIKTTLSYNDFLFAGGYYGVMISSNNGDTWRSLKEGLPDSLVVDDMTIHEGYLYICGVYSGNSGNPGGLYRIPLSQLGTQKEGRDHFKNNLTALYDSQKKQVEIKFFSEAGIAHPRIEMYDILGRIVFSQSFEAVQGWSHRTFMLNNMPVGTYFCRVTSGTNSYITTIRTR